MKCAVCSREASQDDFLCVPCRVKDEGRGPNWLCKIGFHRYHPFACKQCGKDPYTI